VLKNFCVVILTCTGDIMTQSLLAQGKTRRRFLKEVALAGGAVVAANGLRGFSAPAAVAQFGQVGTTPVVSTSLHGLCPPTANSSLTSSEPHG
jgi:hypothetical protein